MKKIKAWAVIDSKPQEVKRDDAYFDLLEEVLDEQFPKVEEEGAEKIAMRRGAALVLFSYANMYHNNSLAAREKEAYQKGKENGYAESESNYHFEDAEKECIKQTIDECIKAVEEMNGIDIGDDFDLFAREIKKRLLALRS